MNLCRTTRSDVAIFSCSYLLMALGCGKDNPFKPDGMVGEHAGPKTMLAAGNIDSACIMMLTQIFPAVARANETTDYDDGPGFKTKGQTVPGLVAGTVLLTEMKVSVSGSDFVISFKYEFDDFSNDGLLFIGGRMSGSVRAPVDQAKISEAKMAAANFSLTAELAVAGAFDGIVPINYQAEGDEPDVLETFMVTAPKRRPAGPVNCGNRNLNRPSVSEIGDEIENELDIEGVIW